jgi:asparagine synthase (glutamine-hydrolysing)
MPCILSSCDFSDFRPVLQAASIACRGERLYPPGPWDEEAAWYFGAAALRAPLRVRPHVSVAFRHTGYHVLRGAEEGTFAAFRCGTILDRFSQIDMLHCDVWWRGHNVLADPGSYLYNGPEVWHRHFNSTGSHNTIQVDGRDQMLHFRKFKNLYWTQAELIRFEENDYWTLAEGEHYGFTRQSKGCVHKRCVVHAKNADLWIVMDRIGGTGDHDIRLHWLGGDFPYTFDAGSGQLTLDTPGGPFSVTVLDAAGHHLACSAVAGQENPPRGWLSRYYGEKTPVPSLAAELRPPLPFTAVTVLCGGDTPRIDVSGRTWRIRTQDQEFVFSLDGDSIHPEIAAVAQCES